MRNDARSKIENKWPEILQELHIPLSDKEASVEDKLSHILKNLRDDGGNKISSSRLEAAVAQVIGRQYRQEVVQLIRNAERVSEAAVVCKVLKDNVVVLTHYTMYNYM